MKFFSVKEENINQQEEINSFSQNHGICNTQTHTQETFLIT